MRVQGSQEATKVGFPEGQQEKYQESTTKGDTWQGTQASSSGAGPAALG